MQGLWLDSKWGKGLSLAVLFISVALFAWTGSYLLLSLPFAYLFILLAGANWKTAYWILLFTIPASIQLGFFGDTLSTTVPDEPIMWMFLLVFTLALARDPKLFPMWWWRNPLVLIVVLQFLWMLVAVIFSLEPLYSIKFTLAKCWFLVSFFVMPLFIFNEKKDFKTGFILLLVPIFITMSIIMVRHAGTGFNFRKIDKSISLLYYNHVEYSTVLSMFFPLLCVAFLMLRGRTGWRLVVGGLILYFLVAIYLSYARAAMLAVVFALVVAAAIRIRLMNLVMPVFYALMILLIGYMVRENRYIDFRPDYHETYMHGSFTSHIIATFRGQDMSSMERLYRWIAGARMSMDRPITGVGPNAFYYYYKPYTVTSFRTYVSRNDERSTTHNYFLYMLVEQGWPALILYGILVYAVFAQAQKIYHRFKDRFHKLVTIGIAMMFGAGFINNFFSELLETHKVGCLFFISIALLVILDKKSKDEEKELAEKGISTLP
jgi:O-antigen ligase